MKNRNLKQILGKEKAAPSWGQSGQILCLLCLTLLAFPLKAQEGPNKEQESTLDTITVKAARSNQKVFDLPAMNSVIELDSPSLVFPSTLSDIFASQPWLDFTRSARRNGQVPVMRGYSGDAIIVLFDGVRQNFEAQHDGKFFIDPSLLKRVEVLRGPNSALYGSGGLGGVIAFETKDAADLLKPGENFGVLVSSGYQSVNNEYLESLALFGRTKTLDILGSYSWRTSDDIQLPGNTELPADDRLHSGLFKMGWSLSEHHTLRLGFQGYHNNAVEPNEPQGLRPDLAVLVADVDKDTSSYTTRLAYEYANPQQPWLQFKSQFFSTQTQVKEKFTEDVAGPPEGTPPMPSLQAEKGQVLLRRLDTVGGNFDFQSFFGKKDKLSNNLSYGLEYYSDTQEGSDSGSVDHERSGVPDAEANYLGIYLQNELSLSSPIGDFLFIPGLRYDKYSSKRNLAQDADEEQNENKDEAASAKFGLTYKPLKWFMIFGNYGEAFRAPKLTEVYANGTHFSIPQTDLPDDPSSSPPCVSPGCTSYLPGGSNVFTPNPDLKPERNVSTEGGIGFQFKDLLLKKDALSLKGSYFDIKSEDYIDQSVAVTRSPTVDVIMGPPPPITVTTGTCCGTTSFKNVPEAHLWGWEAELHYDSSRAAFALSYAYINGVDRESGEFLGNLTPDKYSGDLGLKFPEIASVFGVRVHIAGKHDRVPPATDDPTTREDESEGENESAKREGYTVYDLYYQYRPKSFLEGLMLKLGVDNVGNREYSRIYAGSLEPGVNYKGSLSYQW